MDSLSSVSPSIVLPPTSDPFRLRSRRRLSVAPLSASHSHGIRRLFSSSSSSSSYFVGVSYSPEPPRRRIIQVSFSLRGGAAEEEEDADGREDVERALHLDGTIPGTSDEFVKRMSSRAYDMRRHLHQTFDSSSYDVLEANPWRETSKPVYVLTQRENQLCTMKTRRNRSEVERELGLLFSKGGKWRSGIGNQPKQSRTGTKFQMLVEDIREGVLVFEDENEAAKYCDLLQGGGQGCEGVAEIEASSVFDLCQKMRALAVLFRRGRTPPLPQSLELNLKARKRSLEDAEDLL
ncbi:hypothetical protein F2P56_024395 [Juglans regia]|uniref:Uncharacterized protein LOC108999648 n=2 Tax=Juglans regia TaxID=51240 RepID=A0A2I4FKD0_JUGRE|nr:uncharacterized protein LOC108999648 [Juglans regia]KAF5454751.1 hypothetical protein F2P56_024395 [Juglans regia]